MRLGKESCRTSLWRCGRGHGSNFDRNVLAVIQKVARRALYKASRCSALISALVKGVHKCVSEPQNADTALKRLIDAPAPTVPSDKFIKHKVDKRSLDNAEMAKRGNKLTAAVEKKKVEYGMPTKRLDSSISPGPPTNISDDKKATLKAYGTSKSLVASNIGHHQSSQREKKNRRRGSRR